MFWPIHNSRQFAELHGLPQRYRGVRALWVSAVSGSTHDRVRERFDVLQRGNLLCQPRNHLLLARAMSVTELSNSALHHVG
jgi:hypothetical protein